MASVGWLIVLAAAELGAFGSGRCGMGHVWWARLSGSILGWFFGRRVIPLSFAGSGCLGLNCKCTAEGGRCLGPAIRAGTEASASRSLRNPTKRL